MFSLPSWLNPKVWITVAALGVATWGAWHVYDWVWQRGYDNRDVSAKKEIDKADKARDKAIADYETYKSKYDQWVVDSKKANDDALAARAKDLDAREKRLAQAEADARNKPVTVKEVIRYVPAEVDATFRLPLGFVRLYRDTLEGQSALSASAGMAGSFSNDVTKTSGLTMSDFGSIAAFNNQECVMRGKVIAEWQDWYAYHQKEFEAFLAQQQQKAPK